MNKLSKVALAIWYVTCVIAVHVALSFVGFCFALAGHKYVFLIANIIGVILLICIIIYAVRIIIKD